MAKKSNAAKIREYIAANPGVKPADIAAKFGVKVQYVYVLRSKMKKVVDKITPKSRSFKWENVATTSSNQSVRPMMIDMSQHADGSITEKITYLDPATGLATHTDMVNHPPHYKVGGIETIDFIEAKGLNYHLGNVVKYVTRADHKGARLENLKKAQWYLEREIAKSV